MPKSKVQTLDHKKKNFSFLPTKKASCRLKERSSSKYFHLVSALFSTLKVSNFYFTMKVDHSSFLKQRGTDFEKRTVCRAENVCWTEKKYEQTVVSSFDELFLNPKFASWVFYSENGTNRIFMNRFLIACISDVPLQVISGMIGIHKNVWYEMKHFTLLAIWPYIHYNLRDYQIVQYERWCLLRRMKEIQIDFQNKLELDYYNDLQKLDVLQKIFEIFTNTMNFLERVQMEARVYNKFMKTLSVLNMQNMDAINALGIYDMKKNLYLDAVFDMDRLELLHPDSIGSKISNAFRLSGDLSSDNGIVHADSKRNSMVDMETVKLENSLTPLEDWIHFYG